MDKDLVWIGASRKDIRGFPEAVKDDIGFALRQIQRGKKPVCAKPWKGLGPRVLEIVEDFDGDTYRAVYTVKFDEVVYVLHCFQKKSKQGIETSPRDKDLVAQRLKIAEAHYKANYREEKRGHGNG